MRARALQSLLPAALAGIAKPSAMGILVASVSFGSLGSLSALWDNPFFVRMTPAGPLEIAALISLSILAGLFVVIRRSSCSARTAGLGGIVGFLGIACPTCNKVLILLFGGELLMAYFEPLRLYAAAAGVLILAFATARELVLRGQQHQRCFRTSGEQLSSTTKSGLLFHTKPAVLLNSVPSCLSRL